MGVFTGTIQAGGQLSVNVPIYQSGNSFDVKISGVGVSDNDKAMTSSKVYGPFAVDVAFTLTTTGNVMYSTSSSFGQVIYQPSQVPSASSVNPGQEILVSGRTVKSNGQAWLSQASYKSCVPKLCFVGSSLTQHGNGWGPTKISWDSRGWPCWLMALMQDSAVAEQWTYLAPNGNQYTVGSNRGFSGQYASEIDARKADIASMNADYYIVQQGTNDLASKTTSETSAAVVSTAKYLRDTGATVVLLPEPPRWFSLGSGWESGGVAQLRRHALNTIKRNLSGSERGFLCADSESGLVQASGDAVTAQFYDGTHLSSSGAYQWALNIFNGLVPSDIPFREHVISAQNVYDATNNPKGSLVANPKLSGELASIYISNQGSGYSSAPTVSITGGGGSGAAATAVLGSGATAGKVVSVTVTNAGSGYTSLPDISFSGGGGAGAAATPQLKPSGWTKSSNPTGITGFDITTNSDGTSTVTITTDGTGTAGAVTAVSLLRDSPITHNVGEAIYAGVKVRSVSQTVPCLYGVKPYVRCSKTGETIIYGFGMEKYLSSSYPGSKTSYWPAIGTRSLYCRTPRVVIPYDGASIKAGVYFEFNAAVAGTTTIVLEGIDCFSGALPWDVVGVKQDTGYASQNIYGGTDV